jgi:hypothetical protein
MRMIMEKNPKKKVVVIITVIATSQHCTDQRSRSKLRHALPKIMIKKLPLKLNSNRAKMSLLVHQIFQFFSKMTRGSIQQVSLLLLLIQILITLITITMKSRILSRKNIIMIMKKMSIKLLQKVGIMPDITTKI